MLQPELQKMLSKEQLRAGHDIKTIALCNGHSTSVKVHFQSCSCLLGGAFFPPAEGWGRGVSPIIKRAVSLPWRLVFGTVGWMVLWPANFNFMITSPLATVRFGFDSGREVCLGQKEPRVSFVLGEEVNVNTRSPLQLPFFALHFFLGVGGLSLLEFLWASSLDFRSLCHLVQGGPEWQRR